MFRFHLEIDNYGLCRKLYILENKKTNELKQFVERFADFMIANGCLYDYSVGLGSTIDVEFKAPIDIKLVDRFIEDNKIFPKFTLSPMISTYIKSICVLEEPAIDFFDLDPTINGSKKTLAMADERRQMKTFVASLLEFLYNNGGPEKKEEVLWKDRMVLKFEEPVSLSLLFKFADQTNCDMEPVHKDFNLVFK